MSEEEHVSKKMHGVEKGLITKSYAVSWKTKGIFKLGRKKRFSMCAHVHACGNIDIFAYSTSQEGEWLGLLWMPPRAGAGHSSEGAQTQIPTHSEGRPFEGDGTALKWEASDANEAFVVGNLQSCLCLCDM